MIIVDMPWIMNGEPELIFPHYLTSHFRPFCIFFHSWHLKNYCISAAWKIVKTWLGPEAISKLRFASKSEVQTFIGPEYLPAHMGGTVRCCSFFNGQYSCL